MQFCTNIHNCIKTGKKLTQILLLSKEEIFVFLHCVWWCVFSNITENACCLNFTVTEFGEVDAEVI